jgi:hypothetical protein
MPDKNGHLSPEEIKQVYNHSEFAHAEKPSEYKNGGQCQTHCTESPS